MATTGMFSQIFMALGIWQEPKNILLDADKYWWIAVLSDVWKEAGWGTILYLATMAGLIRHIMKQHVLMVQAGFGRYGALRFH